MGIGMSANKMLPPVTAQQPSDQGELNVLTMSNDQIVSLISAIHDPADDNFDAHSLFLVVKNILKRATHMVDNDLQGQDHLENLEEKVCRTSFYSLVCTLKQLFSEMRYNKALGVESAHETMMSILDKLSSYSWIAKAVLTLAAFVLNLENFLTLEQLHSLHIFVSSMEIPKHIPVTLKHLDLQKCGKMSGEVNKIINDTLDVMESIFELNISTNNELKEEPELLSYVEGDITVGVYWIIISVVACTTQMYCLTSDEDKTKDLLPLAQKINHTLFDLKRWIGICHRRIEEKKARRKLEELLQTPHRIMEIFKALIFAKDDKQPLFDGSTNEMVNIDVLEKKNVLLFISSLDIPIDDISILMSIYDGIRKMGDQYKIVWFPIVEQWTDNLRKKFEMLRSKMPWYIVKYSSPIAYFTFIKEWNFENKPIVIVMNPQGDMENENALEMIGQRGMMAFPFTRRSGMMAFPLTQPRRFTLHMTRLPGPYAIEDYTFLCGGKDNSWIEQFSKKVNIMAEDPIINKARIFIKLSRIERQPFWRGSTRTIESDLRNQEIQNLLLSFKNESRWAVLTKWSTRVVSDQGTIILKFLEEFEKWKENLLEKGFEICFKECHDKLLQTGSLPSTSKNV